MAELLSVRELARLALPDAYGLLKGGKLTLRQIWLAAHGARKYRRAVAEGDIAPEPEQDRRVDRCAGCKAMTMTGTSGEANGGMIIKMWCGTELTERPEASPPECGCLVGLKVNGVVVPAAKTVVGSSRCSVWE